MDMLDRLVSYYIKFFFLLTPFAGLSVFLSLTKDAEASARRRLAVQVTLATLVVTFIILFLGSALFRVFGITLDAFRIGAGCLVFLSAVDLVRGTRVEAALQNDGDVAVVPLAIPVLVGPGTIGALMVMSAEAGSMSVRAIDCLTLLLAVLSVGGILFGSALIERVLRRRGIAILSKITGLVLSALAAQIVFTGVRGFLGLPPTN